MFKPIIQFLLILLFFSNLYSQNTDLEITIINQHIEKSEINEAEAKLNKILSLDPSYAPGHVCFSKIWLCRANINKATEHANLAVRIDEDLRYWWEEINSFRRKIKTGTSNVHKKNYKRAIEIFSSFEILIDRFKLNIDGCRILTNFGTHGRQEVPHLHFHLLGGKDVGRMLN